MVPDQPEDALRVWPPLALERKDDGRALTVDSFDAQAVRGDSDPAVVDEVQHLLGHGAVAVDCLLDDLLELPLLPRGGDPAVEREPLGLFGT